MVAVTHLALLGVKIQDPAFWGLYKRWKSSRHVRLLLQVWRDEQNEYKNRNFRLWKSGARG